MISLNMHMMTCQVLKWLFYIMNVFCVPRLLWCLCHSITFISRNMSVHLSKDSAWVSSWTQAQSACLATAFTSTKLYCFVTEAMDCLKVSIYSSTMTQSWLHVNVNSSLTSYLLHHHVTSLVCMSVVKISDKFIRPTTVFCGTDLLYQTQHEIQITAGSGSMNESLIVTVGYLCSIAVCLCFHSFIYGLLNFFSLFETSQSGMLILTAE